METSIVCLFFFPCPYSLKTLWMPPKFQSRKEIGKVVHISTAKNRNNFLKSLKSVFKRNLSQIVLHYSVIKQTISYR